MNSKVEAFAALAHEVRLNVFLLLLEAGPGGRSAGGLAAHLEIAPSALSFHLNRLYQAELVARRRHGKQLRYSVRYDTIGAVLAFLDARCCRDSTVKCSDDCGNAARVATAS